MLLIYPLLGVSAFEVVQERPRGDARLFLRGKDAKTEGADRAEGFVVFAGATIRSDTVPSILPYQRALREELQKKGVIQPSTDGLVLAEDYVFTLPTTAAAVVIGRNANGRTEWRDRQGRTLKENPSSRNRTCLRGTGA
jgi:hypothetical protein